MSELNLPRGGYSPQPPTTLPSAPPPPPIGRIAQLKHREAEKAVIEAAGVMAYAISKIEKHSYDEYKAASNNLVAAVATLRELEGA